jgi:hypothetical protein
VVTWKAKGSFKKHWNVNEKPRLVDFMEDLQYESWAIARQLNALYESVGEICGVRVTAIDISLTNRDIIRPTLLVDNNDVDGHEVGQQLLEGLRQQDGLLRQQIRDLIAKLPIRTPDQVF